MMNPVINMEKTERRPNRIPEYDYSQCGAYFVTICTQDRRHILSDIVGDGFPVPKQIGKIVEDVICNIPVRYPGVKVDKYVIMPDHIHLLLRVENSGGTGDPSPTIGNVIGWFKYEATKRTNLLLEKPGEKRFQRSYYDHVIRNQQDYNEVWEYIDNNPMKWIMTRRGWE